MKIIKEGKLPEDNEDNEYDGTCHNCSTIIKFKQHEAKINYDQRDGDFLSIRCPLCNKYINVNRKCK